MSKRSEDFWRCEDCHHVGKESEFRTKDQHMCPKCKCEDTFPCRFYKHSDCGHIAHQNDWFPEFPLDDEPLRERAKADPCLSCESEESDTKLELVPIDCEKHVPQEVIRLVGELLSPEALFVWWFIRLPRLGGRHEVSPAQTWEKDKYHVRSFIQDVKEGRHLAKF